MIVHDFVENHLLPEDLAIFDVQVTHQRKNVPARPLVLSSEKVHILTFFGRDRIIVDVLHRPKAYSAAHTK